MTLLSGIAAFVTGLVMVRPKVSGLKSEVEMLRDEVIALQKDRRGLLHTIARQRDEHLKLVRRLGETEAELMRANGSHLMAGMERMMNDLDNVIVERMSPHRNCTPGRSLFFGIRDD